MTNKVNDDTQVCCPIADQWFVEVKKNVKIVKNSPYTLTEGIRKGSIVLRDEYGFGYNRQSRTGTDGVQTWNCRKWQSRCKCPVTIKVSGDRIILQRNQHSHPTDD